MPHLSGERIISAKEECSLTCIETGLWTKGLCVHRIWFLKVSIGFSKNKQTSKQKYPSGHTFIFTFTFFSLLRLCVTTGSYLCINCESKLSRVTFSSDLIWYVKDTWVKYSLNPSPLVTLLCAALLSVLSIACYLILYWALLWKATKELSHTQDCWWNAKWKYIHYTLLAGRIHTRLERSINTEATG